MAFRILQALVLVCTVYIGEVCCGNYRKTAIIVHFESQPGQDLFIRGGIDHAHKTECLSDASKCMIPIKHTYLGTSPHFTKYNAWKDGDTMLDWHGAQDAQGQYDGQVAQGTPSVWSTDVAGQEGYMKLNQGYGPHHWVIEFYMDCSQAENGALGSKWFEFKAFVTNYSPNGGWEYSINQTPTCGGDAPGSRSKPYSSNNHFGQCGAVNVYDFNGYGCIINEFPADTQRTAVLLQYHSTYGQYMYLAGGIGHERRPECWAPASTSLCSINATTLYLGSGSHYDQYNAMRVYDGLLDWHGAEPLQGTYNGQTALGTPTVWTTNVNGQTGFQPINKYGADYWLYEVDMDCYQTEDGWFEFKGKLDDGNGNTVWESDINQVSNCSGTAAGSKPYNNINHFARCGYVNVFTFNSNTCIIEEF